MQHRGQVMTVPFPSGLMSTARSPAVMPTQFGVDIRNMLLAADGAGRKRNGFSAFGPAVSGGEVNGVFGYLHQGDIQVLASVSDGSIRLLDEGAWTVLKNGLNPAGVVRAVMFGGKLVFCNGTDDLLLWDGVAIRAVEEFVTDASAGLTYVSGTQFTIHSEASLYPVGRKVRARLGGAVYVEAVVSGVSQAGAVTTVTLGTAVLTGALDQVAFAVRPPRFSYLYAAHDRLWGMGQGAIGPQFSAHVDRSRVFYTQGLNDPDAWHDSVGVVPSINLADKAGTNDELIAMAVKDGMSIFFGRQVTQLWSGTDPTEIGDFSWQKTLPVGVPQAALVVELPNDVLFVNAGGARTLSRVLQTEQLDVSDIGSEIDPTLQDMVRGLMADGEAFRRVRHGRHDAQGWFGLALPGVMPVLQVTGRGSGKGSGWTLFDGLPAGATAVGNLPDGRLLMAVGAQLYAYDEAVWADDGADIACRWMTPWAGGKSGKRWANQYVEVLSMAGPKTSLTLRRYRNHDTYNPAVLTVPANEKADFWDDAHWNDARWDNGTPPPALGRDHYVSEVTAYAVENASTVGPIVIFGLTMYGVSER